MAPPPPARTPSAPPAAAAQHPPLRCVSDASYPRETTFPRHIHITSHRATQTHTRDDSSELRFDGAHVAFFFFFFGGAAFAFAGAVSALSGCVAGRVAAEPRRCEGGVAAHLARAGVRDRARVAGCRPLCRLAHVRFGAVSAFAVSRGAREFARDFWQRGIFGSSACRSAALPHTLRCRRRRRAHAARGVSSRRGEAGGRGRARRGRREEGARSRGGGARAGQVCSIGRGVGAVRVRVLCEQVVRTTAACVPRARTAAALARATP